MTLLWLATVVVPSTALAWNLSRTPRAVGVAMQTALADRAEHGPPRDFDEGGRVYRAVETELRALGRLA